MNANLPANETLQFSILVSGVDGVEHWLKGRLTLGVPETEKFKYLYTIQALICIYKHYPSHNETRRATSWAAQRAMAYAFKPERNMIQVLDYIWDLINVSLLQKKYHFVKHWQTEHHMHVKQAHQIQAHNYLYGFNFKILKSRTLRLKTLSFLLTSDLHTIYIRGWPKNPRPPARGKWKFGRLITFLYWASEIYYLSCIF